jgi:DNA helicase II / ATP-dependent DNA helicase PcrA
MSEKQTTAAEQVLSQFQEEYNNLNSAQKEAVDSIEGPVMVIAGPGTGKTQILAIRIGKILLETDTQPESILCMTYTDSGAIAMRKRLLRIIGPDAYKVNIHTYHSFCNLVIQDNLSFFEKTALDPISELESIALFRELIDRFPKGHPLKRYRSDVYFEAGNLRQLFGTIKKEGWKPQDLVNAIHQYLDDLPNRDEYVYKKKYKHFNAGDLKTEKINEEREKMTKLEAAVLEFDKYQKLMKDRRRYDFDDMINWVIAAFKESTTLLLKYQEQFQYVLVDEYQDTSGTQNELVEMLISYWDEPNVFVVGDDDQSIFRFQGANVENMLLFRKKYPEIKTIMLTENYRSVQSILDVSKTLIEKNKERLIHHIEGLSKTLSASKPSLKGVFQTPVVNEWRTPREEMIGITKAVEELIHEGVEPRQIAVIYKENRFGEEISTYLKFKQIPYYSKRNLNLLNIPLVKKLIRVFEYLDAETDTPFSGDEMLFEILHYDWFNIEPIEVAKMSIESNELRFKKQPSSFRTILEKKSKTPAPNLFEKGISTELAAAASFIESMIGAVHNATLQQMLEKIIRESGLLRVIMQAEDTHWQIQVITGFFDFVKNETKKEPNLDLNKFVGLIQMMKKEELSLPIVQVGGSEKGVNLLTAHGSKGLEFKFVFIAGCNASYWERKKVNNRGYKLPDTIFLSHPASNSEEELRRLFYVALTRAEQFLTVSYAEKNEDGKSLEPSMFIEEIRAVHALQENKPVPDEKTLNEFLLLMLTAPQGPRIEKMDKDIIDKSLDKFSMNVTALNNYLNCPLEFYYRNLIRIPSPKSETLEFGSAVHYALESFFNRMKEDNERNFPALEVLIEDFTTYLYRHRESFTREEFERRLEYGKEVLDRYYAKKINQFNKIVSVEKNIRNVLVDGIPLKGKIDKLEFNGHEVNVVDYKTGNPDNTRDKFKTPAEAPPHGGDYWRQAVFYKLLVDHHEQGRFQVKSTEFDFIEPNAKKEISSKIVHITHEDTLLLRKQIAFVWERIQAHDFYTGCGETDCHWCNFVQTNKLSRTEEEEIENTDVLP